jgi:hypothetical protein
MLLLRMPQNGKQYVSILPQIAHPASAAERWASHVLRACNSDKDLKTLGTWAHQAAVSYTSLCESCRLINVQPRSARDFVRVLRLVIMPSFDSRQLATFLDISDSRTLCSILDKAGFERHAAFFRHTSVASFLDQQQFIARENTGLEVIRAMFCSTLSVADGD